MTAPTPADDEPTWAERVRAATTEVLDVNDLTLALAETRRGSASWSRLVHDSHEKLRAEIERLRAGVSPQPEITRQDIWDAIAGAVESYLGEKGVGWAADAVWALLADGATPAGPEVKT